MGRKGSDTKKEPDKQNGPSSRDSQRTAKKTEGWLSALRPKKRVGFFGLFVAYCLWLFVFYDPCAGERKKRKDCGYSGIGALECRTSACFVKGGGQMTKRTVKLEREKGKKVGLEVEFDVASGLVAVKDVRDGAAREYNKGRDDENTIRAGDFISKINGVKGKAMVDSLKGTGAKTFELELQRTKLPWFLHWLRRPGRPTLIEKVVTSPGFERWLASFRAIAPVGVATWYVSGYPPLSLPLYYVGLSGVAAFHTTRCCFDPDSSPGTPQCYRGGHSLGKVHGKAYDQSAKLAANIWKNPRSYAKWLFAE